MADQMTAFRAGSPQTYLADVSEFQPEIADAAYLAWSKAIVIRAMYGDAHDDKAWYGGERRALLHQGGVRFLGLYQFIVPDQDPVAQARAFVKFVGPLRPGELPVGDLETGGSGQPARWAAWSAVIREAYGITPWLYSGLDFSIAHGLHPEWVAAYQSSPPAVPWLMWQFTDSFDVPGVGSCDCSVFRGTIAQLAAHAFQGKPAPGPSPKPAEEEEMPSGVIQAPHGVRESHSWLAGSASQIVLKSDWEGVQPEAPVVVLRTGRLDGAFEDAGQTAVTGTTVYDIPDHGTCNGCSFTRSDGGAATVAFHTNP